jgi:hypothetical protein
MSANVHDLTLVESPDDVQKRKYLDTVWAMSKDQMFKELMRVHGESTRMMMEAQAQIEDLLMRVARHEGLQ